MQFKDRWRTVALVAGSLLAGSLVGPPLVQAATAGLVTIQGAKSTNQAKVSSTGRTVGQPEPDPDRGRATADHRSRAEQLLPAGHGQSHTDPHLCSGRNTAVRDGPGAHLPAHRLCRRPDPRPGQRRRLHCRQRGVHGAGGHLRGGHQSGHGWRAGHSAVPRPGHPIRGRPLRSRGRRHFGSRAASPVTRCHPAKYPRNRCTGFQLCASGRNPGRAATELHRRRRPHNRASVAAGGRAVILGCPAGDLAVIHAFRTEFRDRTRPPGICSSRAVAAGFPAPLSGPFVRATTPLPGSAAQAVHCVQSRRSRYVDLTNGCHTA